MAKNGYNINGQNSTISALVYLGSNVIVCWFVSGIGQH